ncbi:SMC-Scp complex subunit ScpB [Calycomorphotria hydatis]|uniref:Segregation and condensation protein B n=1 Tax=Calycomorphotria hydatis TaxID=2528027 RepID=A0A517TDG4_9PLAN|nr:SMC-Scp complex subunit ScpB [Calycomorphotria hydatis]QDT66415.1 hypothetical protein V22_36820 [Calycomorphotria hydatis]
MIENHRANWGPRANDWSRVTTRGSALRFFHGREENRSRPTDKLARLEAALFVADKPLTVRKLVQHALLADVNEAKQLIEQLNVEYEQQQSAFRVERVAAGYQLMSDPRFAPWLDKLHQRPTRMSLSPPAAETLTILAYRQPMTRADIEAIRGVKTADLLKQLIERGLVHVAGEDDSLGRPYLYATTRDFLTEFGLRSLADLPDAQELRKAREKVEVTVADEDSEQAQSA